jgi:spermidine synthase
VVSQRVLGATGSQLAAMCASFGMAAFCIVFVPTVLLGAAFPYVVRLSVDVSRPGSGLGAVLAVNTLGGIAGSVLAGFMLVPWIGVVHTLGVLAVASGVVALLATAFGTGVHRFARVAVPLLAVVTLIVAVVTPADGLPHCWRRRAAANSFSTRKAGATVAVVEQGKARQPFRRLYIQGVSNSGDTMTSLRYMRLQALLPLLIHNGAPRSTLVIGLGTGITAGALLQYPGLEHRVVAELLPAVARGAELPGQLRRDWRQARRYPLARRPARAAAKHPALRPDHAGAAAAIGQRRQTCTRAISSSSLRASGDGRHRGAMVAPADPEPEDTRSPVRSFLDVFPHATLWTTELHEMLLVGSLQPVTLDVARIQSRFADAGVSAALRRRRGIACRLAGHLRDRSHRPRLVCQ